jgi:hypothetical protein
MTHLTEEQTALYVRVPTPGGRFPIVVNLFLVWDKLPTDSKIRDGVRRLRNGRAAGAGGMHAEHLKECVVGRLDMYRTKLLMYRTMVFMARLTKVRC